MVLPLLRLRRGPAALGARGWAVAPALAGGRAAPLADAGFAEVVVRAIPYPVTTIAARPMSQARKVAAVAA